MLRYVNKPLLQLGVGVIFHQFKERMIFMNEMNKENYDNPTLIRASYGTRELFGQWVAAAFGFSVFFFYEAVIGLNTLIAMLVFIIYSIWNAINDPLVGYLMERIHPFWEKKWGIRRFPLMIFGAVCWLVTYLFIFMVPLNWDPVNDQWLIFWWYLISICLYDFFIAIWDVNVLSVFPDKFKSLNERRSVQGFGTIFGILGLVLAAVIPPMFINEELAITYRTSALVTMGVALLLLIVAIPGIWENKKVQKLYKDRRTLEKKGDIESFFKTAKIVLTNRRFVSKALHFFGYQVAAVMIQTSAFYITTYILDSPANTITLLLGAMLIGAFVSVPLWTYFSKKINNNKKMGVLAGIILFVTFLPMIFVQGIVGWVISLLLFGTGIGGHWFIDPPLLADVLDDVAITTGKRQQAIYYGYQAFFARFGYTFIALTISLTHVLTGFVEGAPSLAELIAQSPTPQLALFGIRIHSAIVPAIFVLLTTIIFWKFYDLDHGKVVENKKKLAELGL
jgi:GPH family glycoside/pentoside/hexuronide:cation symporter